MKSHRLFSGLLASVMLMAAASVVASPAQACADPPTPAAISPADISSPVQLVSAYAFAQSAAPSDVHALAELVPATRSPWLMSLAARAPHQSARLLERDTQQCNSERGTG